MCIIVQCLPRYLFASSRSGLQIRPGHGCAIGRRTGSPPDPAVSPETSAQERITVSVLCPDVSMALLRRPLRKLHDPRCRWPSGTWFRLAVWSLPVVGFTQWTTSGGFSVSLPHFLPFFPFSGASPDAKHLRLGIYGVGPTYHVVVAASARTSSRLRASRPQATATRWTAVPRYLSA